METRSLVLNDFRIECTIFYPSTAKRKSPAVLFVHGWTSNKERSYQYAEALSKLGFICFLFDMRGHGKSEGNIKSFTISQFFEDVLAAYDFLVEMDSVDKENISVVGSSFGGYLTALLSSKRKIKNLVLRVPADYPNGDFGKIKEKSGHWDQTILAWRKKIKQPFETYALSALNKFNGEVLIIESELDDVVPHETLENYKNAILDKSKLTYVLMKNTPHSIQEDKSRNEVEKILTDWFEVRSAQSHV